MEDNYTKIFREILQDPYLEVDTELDLSTGRLVVIKACVVKRPIVKKPVDLESLGLKRIDAA